VARHLSRPSAWLGPPLATADACERVQVSAAAQLPASWPGSLSVSPDAASVTAA
jgi:hypothetical protein